MGQFMPWLAKCAAGTGYPVTEVPGWQSRGHGPMANDIGGVLCHHTATAASAYARSDYPSLGIVRDGRPGLSGPLCNFGLGRSGRIYVVAAGVAYHAGAGGWRGMTANSQVVGIEAESNGLGRGDWTAAQRDAYPRLCAAILDWLNHEDANRIAGHKEWAPGRKVDPTGIDMNQFRTQVAGLLRGGYRKGGGAPAAASTTPGDVSEVLNMDKQELQNIVANGVRDYMNPEWHEADWHDGPVSLRDTILGKYEMASWNPDEIDPRTMPDYLRTIVFHLLKLEKQVQALQEKQG